MTLGNQSGSAGDYLDMDCHTCHAAVSARIDGEGTGHSSAAIDAHLTSCPSCRAWADVAVTVTRLTRVAPVEDVPDLIEPIMSVLATHIADPPPACRSVVSSVPPSPVGTTPPAAAGSLSSRLAWCRPGRPPGLGVARLGLVMVAVAQLAMAVPALLGDDAGAPVHVAHEQGSWALALAVGLLVVAWHPSRASALLPVVIALVAGLALTMTLDVAAGRTRAAAEAPHGLALFGLGFLLLLARGESSLRPGRYSGSTGMKRRLMVAVAATCCAIAGWARPAMAHAVLQSTDPPSGAVLQNSPGTVVLHFGEDVEIQFGALRVFSGDGKRVDTR